jgi:uncharacterized membrane protein (UPF0127 family)
VAKVKVLPVWQYGIGYMFQYPKQPLLFRFSKPRIVSIGMYFVFGPIDVFVLNNNKVIEIKRDLRPWRTWRSKKKGTSFLEAPKGMLKLKIGSKAPL